MFQKTMADFTKQSSALVLEESGWGEMVISHKKDLEDNLKEQIYNERTKEMDKFLQLQEKALKDTVQNIIN